MTEKRPHYKLKFRIAATNAVKRMMPVSQRSLIARYDCRVKATCVVFDSRTRCHRRFCKRVKLAKPAQDLVTKKMTVKAVPGIRAGSGR